MDAFNRKLSSLASAALLSLTAFLFIPAQIQLTNAGEFPYTFLDILGPLALLVSVSFLLVAGGLLVVSGPFGGRLVSAVFAVGFLLYFQANWILWDYGKFDGRDIDWQILAYRGVVDGLVWIVLTTLFVAFGTRFRRLLNWIAALAIVAQSVNLFFLLLVTPGAFSRTEKQESMADLFAFSSDRNVLIILLDTLQSDVLQQVFDEFPADKDVFGGFTFYRNSLSGYPTTMVNVPLILTGLYFRNEINAITFTSDVSASENNLPRFLKDRGFRSHLIGTRGVFIGDEKNADIHVKFLRNTKGLNIREELINLADLAAFRGLPHFAKKRIYNDQKWLFAYYFGDHELEEMPPIENLEDIVFTRDLVRNAFVDDGKPVFKYIHYWGTHPPIRLNEKLEYVELPHSRENFVTYTRAGVAILRNVFTRLKELGVYDNTLIVVTGDHGAGFHQYRADPRVGGVSEELVEDTTVESLTKASALAAMLVKEIGARHSLQYDDSPVALGDYPAAIAGNLDFEHEFPGVDFLKGSVDPERARYFYFYHGYNTNTDHYFDAFTEYRVKGHSWLDESWERTDSLYPAGERKGASYTLGERIEFNLKGNYRQFAPYGFSMPGQEFAWTDRNRAGINIRLPGVTGDLVCRAGLSMVFGPSQTIGIWIDGVEKLTEWNYDKGSTVAEVREFVIPAEVINGDAFTLEFRLPKALYSPKDFGLSGDGRRLGMGLAWLEFSAK